MISTAQKSLALLFITLFLLYWFKLRVRIPKGYKLPPGPPGKFLLGNLLDIPTQKEWLTYRPWAKIYGDLTYLNICGTSILFINSQKFASELFEQRAGIYSNRLQSTMLYELAGWDWSVAMMQPNEMWRRHRAILHQYVGKSVMGQYQAVFEKSARKLLHQLYMAPDKFTERTRHAVGSIIMEITYGIETLPEDDPYIKLADDAIGLITEVSIPGSCLVDFFPILKYVPSWVPGAGFQKKAKRLNAALTGMVNLPFDAVKAAMKAGNPPSSLVGSFLEEIANRTEPSTSDSEDMKIIREIGAIIYLGAIDTSDLTLQVFFLVMILYPDVQKKAQKELDDAVGGTSPSFDDRKNLPYIEAVCKELLRWHPVVPLGFPHLLAEDDIIGEYFVPKGTIVLGNTWSISYTESIYGNDVETFNPERYLKENAKYPDTGFGFGRRVCPGRHLADALLFTMVTHILHTFDIAPYEGSAGPELPDVDAFTPGLLSRPLPFKCKLTPRSLQSKTFLEHLALE